MTRRLAVVSALASALGELPQGIGESPPWRAAMADLRAAAAAPRTPVLVTGESGTGKELAASQLHAWSARAAKPFVSVNAACLSHDLLESELFGHEAGAFTGATSTKRGLFELASGGTLFLDEVGELPLALQPKLLRVLEGHPFRRVGGERAISADVRVVSATNTRMEDAVAAGRFRLDLYHRLRVVEVTLPPLRERGADAELLAAHFVARIASDLGRPPARIAPDTLLAIRAYPWPGNVRELRNAIERALVLCRDGALAPGDLPPEVRAFACAPRTSRPPAAPASEAPARPDGAAASDEAPPPRTARPISSTRIRAVRPLDGVMRDHVLEVFQESGGNIARAARVLGIGRATLRRKLQGYGVRPGDLARRRPA